MCAEPLYRLAREFPDCRFVGVDRQPALKVSNELAYKAPNLTFAADDIDRWMAEHRDDIRAPAMLLHVRTSPFFYPEGLRALYQGCRDAASIISRSSNIMASARSSFGTKRSRAWRRTPRRGASS